jgi:hypothetical protein
MRKLVNGYKRLEDLFFATQPASRKNNQFCQRLSSVSYLKTYLETGKARTSEGLFRRAYASRQKHLDIMKIKLDKYHSARYYWVNFHSIFVHDTIEIRLHSGTTSAKKIYLWTKAHSQLIRHLLKTSEKKSKEITADEFVNGIATPDVKEYLLGRVARFEKEHKFRIDELEKHIDRDVEIASLSRSISAHEARQGRDDAATMEMRLKLDRLITERRNENAGNDSEDGDEGEAETENETGNAERSLEDWLSPNIGRRFRWTTATDGDETNV